MGCFGDVEITHRWREDPSGFGLQHETGEANPPSLGDVEITAYPPSGGPSTRRYAAQWSK